MARGYPKPKEFHPKHPEKYKGQLPIIARSKLEFDVMRKLDLHTNVKSWSSESVVVPYISPVDGRKHRYFVDLQVEVIRPNGEISIELIEIKPYSQCFPPKITDKMKNTTKRKLIETYAVNQAKWDSAKAYCNKMGWHWHVIHEVDLYGKQYGEK